MPNKNPSLGKALAGSKVDCFAEVSLARGSCFLGFPANGSLYYVQAHFTKLPVLFVISPARRESQINGNISINVIDLTLDQFPFDKVLYILIKGGNII